MRFWDNVKPLAERPQDEQDAIREYCRTAHYTNVPHDLDTARWGFSHNPKNDHTTAGLVLF